MGSSDVEDEEAARRPFRESGKREDSASSRPMSLKDRIDHFTWQYFACTMSTGAIAVVLAQTPHQFPGLGVIGKIFFILDLVILTLFSLIIVVRFFLHPRSFLRSFHQPPEGLFFGTFWVSVALVIDCIQAYGVPSCGPWLVKTMEIIFWMYVASVLLVAIVQYFFIFSKNSFDLEDAMPAWVFPIYPLLVIGPMAGLIIKTQPQSAAWTIWVGAVMLQGLAWTVALTIYTMYTTRLMTGLLPAPENRPGMYISVGPAGYTAAGLLSLGSQAPSVFPANEFSIHSIPVGDVVDIIGIISGTFLIIFAFWYFAISTIAVLAGFWKMKFTVNWWAFIFPNAGMTLAAIQLGKAYKSGAINGICSALTLLLVILWLIVAVAQLNAVVRLWLGWRGRAKEA